ncbi:MAG: glycine cleavage system aminomethyltransferase GcvT [Nitrospirota bacterium]|mgnify:CR=1 FL=1
MTRESTLKRTPLYAVHQAAGAKLVDFSGWEMPLQYQRAADEVKAVRTAAGLTDVSHLGRIEVRGPRAKEFLDVVTSNDVAALKTGQAHYSFVLNPDGGILDDIVIYRAEPLLYIVCCNASNSEKLARWFGKHGGDASFVEDVTARDALIALQGPSSFLILQTFVDFDLKKLALYHIRRTTIMGEKTWLARTGYTGERGYEIWMPGPKAAELWDSLMEAGEFNGLVPAGLSARDLLRLEMGFPLYGHELNERTTPVEAGLLRGVSFKKGEFVGRSALEAQTAAAPSRVLVGFEMLSVEQGIPREGYSIHSNGSTIGEVTSGNISPTLRKPIGMGYVAAKYSKPGMEVWIDIRGKAGLANIVTMPFYKKVNR